MYDMYACSLRYVYIVMCVRMYVMYARMYELEVLFVMYVCA